jgi:hypothetical protein
MKTLSLEEKATNFDTMEHIENVRNFINVFVAELLIRGVNHDQTKLESPEVELFTEYTDKLAGVTYGSDEYKSYLEKLKVALDHHYAKNRHHPEHFVNGVNDMNLIDIIEMFCDWKAATLRHDDGNLQKSIDHNAKRFNMSDQLTKIFRNTVELFDK